MSTVTLSLFRFPGPLSQLWAVGQMALARRPLRRERDLRFFKLCGSGTGEGFTPRPNWQVWAILAVWSSEDAARRAVNESPVWQSWRSHASESWTIYLDPVSARGSWSGVNPFLSGPAGARPDPAAPVVALTRATLRPRHLGGFWKRVPGISAAIGDNADVTFKIGIGEVPLFHQVTFSVWPDARTLSAFAHADGPHARAIRAVRAEGWFAEELYARFRLVGTQGSWEGGDPLAALNVTERTAA